MVARFDAWVFDLDNTLYPAACNLFAQIDRRMKDYIVRNLGLDHIQAHALQKKYYRTHGTTLRGLMLHHGVAARDYLDYVHDIDLAPILPAPQLERALAAVAGRKLVFTNGSASHAERVLARLGIGHHFEAVFDVVDAEYLPKPEPATYRRFVACHGLDARRSVMFEDLARNLAPAAALGMTTVWVRHADSEAGAHDHVDHVTEDLAGWLAAAG